MGKGGGKFFSDVYPGMVSNIEDVYVFIGLWVFVCTVSLFVCFEMDKQNICIFKDIQ